MSNQKVYLHVDANGVTKIEAKGYEGGTCMEATAPFEAMFTKVEKPREMAGACGPQPTHGERVR